MYIRIRIIFVLTGWLKFLYRFLFISFRFDRRDLGKCVIPLDHIYTQNKNKRNMTYQQHLSEWDIPLSEPSCFSYSHTLKAFQCLFLFNNDVACTRTWQQRFIV